jgi:hypothetical protein
MRGKGLTVGDSLILLSLAPILQPNRTFTASPLDVLSAPMYLQHRIEERLLVRVVLIQRSYRNSRSLRYPRRRQSIRSHRQQNLNGRFCNRLYGHGRPLLNGRLSWLKRMWACCPHNANSRLKYQWGDMPQWVFCTKEGRPLEDWHVRKAMMTILIAFGTRMRV